MKSTSKFTETVYNKVYSDGNKQQVVIDPVTMSLIAGVVIELIKAIIACRQEKKKKQEQPVEEFAKQVALNPTQRQKRVLRRELRKKFGRKHNIDKHEEVIISTGQELTNEELKEMFDETRAETNENI